MQNFITLIEENAKQYPQYTAISLGKQKLTYEKLFNGILNVQHNAKEFGLVKGDNVAFVCKPDLQGLTLALGLVRLGVTLTIVDPFTSDELFLNRIEASNVTHVIANPILYKLGTHQNLFNKITKKHIVNLNQLPVTQLVFGGKSKPEPYNITQWINGSPTWIPIEADAEQSVVIVYTSGTTSEPKGVLHSLTSLSANAPAFAEKTGISLQSKVFAEPLTLGLVTLSQGGEWIIPDKKYSVPNCDFWFATPSDILKGLKRMNSLRTPVIKGIGIGSAPVTPSLVKKIETVLVDTPIFCVYGMTEMLPITVGDAKEKVKFLSQGDYVGESVGDTQIKIIDDEVHVKGSASMLHYLGRGKEDYISTGDFGYLDETGQLFLLGRKKEMFIRGNMNIYPSLYENRITTISGIKEAALLGIPDAYGDDLIVLAITLENNQNKQQTLKFIKNQLPTVMDHEALPSSIVLLDYFPTGGRADKLDRAALTQLVQKKLGLN